MSVALDLGSHVARSLRARQNELLRRQSRTVALLIPDGPSARTRLDDFRIPYVPCDNRLAIPGNPAAEFAEIFGVACQDLLPDGHIPFDDPVTRQLIAGLIESLLPAASRKGTVCCFTQPGSGKTGEMQDARLERREAFVSRVIRLLGYDPLPINPALALILAEMEPEQFTGVGISVGASGCDLALAHRGTMISAVRIPHGGRAIDEQLAARTRRICVDSFGQCVLDLEGSRRLREQDSQGRLAPDECVLLEQALTDLVAEIALGLDRLLSSAAGNLDERITIVLGGGMALSPGFESRFRKQVRRFLPGILASHIRQAGDADSAIVRGCLIQALLESRNRTDRIRISA